MVALPDGEAMEESDSSSDERDLIGCLPGGAWRRQTRMAVPVWTGVTLTLLDAALMETAVMLGGSVSASSASPLGVLELGALGGRRPRVVDPDVWWVMWRCGGKVVYVGFVKPLLHHGPLGGGGPARRIPGAG